MQCSTSFGKTDPHLLFTGSWTLGASGLAASAEPDSDTCVPCMWRAGVQACRAPAGCRLQGAGCRVQAAGCRRARPRVRVRAQDSASRRQRAPGAAVPRPGAAREARAEARRASGGPCHVPGRARRRQVGAGAAGCARLRAGPRRAGPGGRGAAGARAGGRDGFALPAASAFRAGPGKVGAARWPRGPGGKCGAGGRGPARTRGHTRGPQRGARLQVAAGGRGTQAGGGDGLASSPLRPRGPARSWGPLVASGAPVGKELSVVSCVAGSRTAPPGASFTAPCGALVLGKLSRPPSERSHKVTLTGSQLTVTITEAAAPECEEKRSLPGQRIAALPRDLSGRIFPASSSKDASAQGEAKEGDVQGQEGAQAGHAGGPAADHHGGAAHRGCGGAPDRSVCVRGHAPGRHRVSTSVPALL
ncbi:single-pass membrane and coiled-coil domain-containing protein 4 [Peromyscus leucopus]|uniref:single-pass membrane and coiled-coil domain-containing protein 4 n=1 Tax=Peromyscus leucopus TaxID=10041 RepID=UPI001884F7A1|nr:single-pass membrane and coiled-coil domain-containing protein 4 [Peromyscus leucopus]